jgi:hypothetical protein
MSDLGWIKLVLFFTHGVSSKTWDDVRKLEEAYHWAREGGGRGAEEHGSRGARG